MAFPAELLQHRMQIKPRLLALVEQRLREFALRRIKPQLAHQLTGQGDLCAAHAAVGFGDMPHHRKGRGEKRGLNALLVAGVMGRTPTGVELMAEGNPKQGAQRPAQQEAESTADNFAPPRHIRKRSRAGGTGEFSLRALGLVSPINPCVWPVPNSRMERVNGIEPSS